MNDSIYRRIWESREKNLPLWLVTIVSTEGSAPARIGMKMLVYGNGAIAGTIGGGDIERRVSQRILEERPVDIVKWNFDLSGRRSTPGNQKTDMECGGTLEVLVEPLGPIDPLYIFGGGHCGMALSSMAARVGFSVTVIDDRPQWAASEKHPGAAGVVCVPYGEILPHIEFGPGVSLVIMTHGHDHDELVLKQLLGKKYRYLGMIGSKRKVGFVLKRMKSEGYGESELKRIFAPIGFPIGSHTPEEIAVSILAQLIAVKHGIRETGFNSNPLRGSR